MDSSLYYTFSTIAQTLSAAIALLAAFALFRLQSLGALMAETSLRIEEAFDGDDHGAFQSMRVAGKYADCQDFIDRSTRRASLDAEPVRSRRATFEGALAAAANVKRWLFVSLTFTVIVVLGSLVVLTRAPVIAQLASAPHVLLGGVVATAICLAAYIALIRSALE